jgi:hypothetical protein
MIITYDGSGFFRALGLARLQRPYRKFLPDYFWNTQSACVWIVPGTVSELNA